MRRRKTALNKALAAISFPPGATMILTQTEARQLIDRILSFAKAEECQVSLSSSENSHTRYANNEITTSGTAQDFSLTIAATIEKRTGRVTFNELSDASLKRAVARAEEIARIAPPDPEYLPPIGAQKYPEINSYFEETAKARAQDRLPGVRAVIEPAVKQQLDSSGFFTNSAVATAFGNKRGNFRYHRTTNANYSATVRTPDGTGSGWASDGASRITDIDADRLASTAIRKAVESRQPQRIEPGHYTVILEPAAVNDLIPLMMGSFNARQADQGFSFLAKRGGGNLVGEQVFSEQVTLRSDPFDPRLPGLPWGGDGLPAEKVTWVEKGVVKNLAYDRYWAEQANHQPVPMGNFIMEGGTATLEELIKSTKRGLLVTHFWYIRTVNPQTVQLTGLTRDGLFLIEDGRIKMPVMNLRFNDSPAQLLSQVEALSQAVRTGSGLERGGGSIAPAIKASRFYFSSVSDAV
jgi:predicted Zn-dependent protease